MNHKSTLTMAAFGLTMSAISAQSADIKISSLPFAITAPGTYVVTGNLSFQSQQGSAITIPSSLSGAVILDLNGFTLTGGGGISVGVGIGGGFTGPFVANSHPITVRNGTLKNFAFGVWAETNVPTAPLTSIEVNNLTFFLSQPPAGNSTCVLFGGYVDSSSVTNCSFNNAAYGIQDVLSFGGNRYTNNYASQCRR
jgi:hypothetical protein